MPVTKSHLIDHLSDKRKLPKAKAELVVNVIFDSMVAALQRSDRIEIRGFGSFEVRQYKSYEGRNPRTGEPVLVEPKRLPFFKVGKELRERVNQEPAAADADADADAAESDAPAQGGGAIPLAAADAGSGQIP